MNFIKGNWSRFVDVHDFIQHNYTPYDGDESFLSPPTEKTKALWAQVQKLMEREVKNNGVLDIDEHTISTITSHKCGYIDKELETIVGLQTDAPLKRAIMPFGGIRMVRNSLAAYGRELPPDVENVFKYRKTHNDGVFDVYTDDMKRARHTGIITGLPDAYGRGRIIGDYRRVPLYGVDFLIEDKQRSLQDMNYNVMDEEAIRRREETAEQVRALHKLKRMAESYGYDISQPAKNAKAMVFAADGTTSLLG